MVDLGKDDNQFMRQCLGLSHQKKTKSQVGRGPDDVFRVLEKSQPELSACLREKTSKPVVAGAEKLPQPTFVVRGSVLASGELKRLTWQEPSPKQKSCFESVLKKVTFAAQTGGDATDFSAKLQIVAPSQAKFIKTGVSILNMPKVSMEAKWRAYNRGQLPIRRCYDKALQTAGRLSGRVGVRVRVVPNGKVSAVEILEDTVNNQKLTGCLTNVIQKWRFPAYGGKQSVHLHYPFIFSNEVQ